MVIMVGSCSSKSTVIAEMQELQNQLAAYYHRVKVIEKNLNVTHHSDEYRGRMEEELQNINMKLATLESDLKSLQRENSKTFAFAVLLMFFSFLVYGLYVMTFGVK